MLPFPSAAYSDTYHKEDYANQLVKWCTISTAANKIDTYKKVVDGLFTPP